MKSTKIYEVKIIQSDNSWFNQRRHTRFNTIVSYHILYHSMKEVEAYIKHTVDNEFADLICFIVNERFMDVLYYKYEEVRTWVFDQYGKDVSLINHQPGDIVEILNKDEIVLGVVSEIKDKGYMVMTTSMKSSSQYVETKYIFEPHFRIPISTRVRLSKAFKSILH